MAIAVANVSTHETGGTAYSGTLGVTQPALAVGDVHVIAVTSLVSGTPTDPFTSPPTNYTLLTSFPGALNNTTNTFMHIFYRVASSTLTSTTVTLTMSGAQVGKLAAVSWKVTGADPVSPFLDGHSDNNDTLVAPSMTPSTANSELFTVFGTRQVIASGSLTFTDPGGMTSVGSIATTTSNVTTQVATDVTRLDLTGTTATGTKTATSSPTGSTVDGSISFLMNAQTSVQSQGITYEVGAKGGTTAGSQQAVSIGVRALAATDVHIVGVTVNTTGGTVTGPAGYTAVQQAMNVSPFSATPSTANSVYLFYRKGATAQATLTFTAAATNCRMSVASVIAGGVDSTTPLDGTPTSDDSLTAPSRTVTTGDELVAICGVREGTAAGGFSITQPTPMNPVTSQFTAMPNLTTNTGVLLATQDTTAGSTGTKVFTTDANAGFLAGAIMLALNAAPVVAAPPDAPILSTASVASGSVSLSWNAPNSPGSPLGSYHIQQRVYTGNTPGAWTDVSPDPGSGATTATISSLLNGTKYGFQIRATNSSGPGPYSAEATGTPTASAQGSGFRGVLGKIKGLVHYYPLDSTSLAVDEVGTLNGTVHGSPSFGTGGCTFSGTVGGSQYITLPDSPDFSVSSQAADANNVVGMTIIVGMAVTNWSSNSGYSGGFMHYMGKGGSPSNSHEWTMRQYKNPDDLSGQNRNGRVSGYHYNPSGGSGTGSYVEETVANGTMRMMALGLDITTIQPVPVFAGDSTARGFSTSRTDFPGGTWFWRNGIEQDSDGFKSGGGGSNIAPTNGTSLVYIATRGELSWQFNGTLRRVMFFNRKLATSEVKTIWDNWGLAEGSFGGPGITAPSAPQSLVVTRLAADTSKATATWTAPSDNGGGTVSGYHVSWAGGNLTGGPFLASSPYQIASLPQAPVVVTVTAINEAGDGAAATYNLAAASVVQPLLGNISDNFAGPADPSRHFDAGVVERNGELEWDTVDATHRSTWVEGDFRSQAIFYQVTPSLASSTIASMFVRSVSDNTKILRIAVLNGSLYADYRDGATVLTSTPVAYDGNTHRYWRIVDANGAVTFQASSDGQQWLAFTNLSIPSPSWLNDVQAGVEQYTGSTL